MERIMNSLALTQSNLTNIINLVVNSVDSPHSKRSYKNSIEEFISWWETAGKPPIIKATIQEYKSHLMTTNYSASTINLKMCAIRKLAMEAADNGLIPEEHANGISRVKGVKLSLIHI